MGSFALAKGNFKCKIFVLTHTQKAVKTAAKNSKIKSG